MATNVDGVFGNTSDSAGQFAVTLSSTGLRVPDPGLSTKVKGGAGKKSVSFLIPPAREDLSPRVNLPTRSPINTILAICHICRVRRITTVNSQERMDCGHYVCRECLLQLLALSLSSPEYMSLMCCGYANIETHQAVKARVARDPELGQLMHTVRECRAGRWACPKNHGPRNGSLMVTNTPIPFWKQVVHCDGCFTERRGQVNNPRNSFGTEFCLFCTKELDLGGNGCGWYGIIMGLVADATASGSYFRSLRLALETMHRAFSGAEIDFRPWLVEKSSDSDEWSGSDASYAEAAEAAEEDAEVYPSYYEREDTRDLPNPLGYTPRRERESFNDNVGERGGFDFAAKASRQKANETNSFVPQPAASYYTETTMGFCPHAQNRTIPRPGERTSQEWFYW